MDERRKAVAELLLPLALTVACGSAAPSAESKSERPPAVSVQVVPARARTVDRTIDIVGTLHPSQEAHLAAEVEGQIKRVRVDLGDRVSAGQVLVEIDTDMLSAALRQADVRAQNAGADAERAESLRREGVVSPQEYDRLRTARDAARAERDVAAIRLAHATVRAPIAGAVTARNVDAGDYARAGSPLVTIVDDHLLRLRGEVAERSVPEVAVGQELRGEVDAFPGLTVRGRVARLNAALDTKNRSLTLEAEVDNADLRLRPGFFVRGSVLTQRGVATVSVPAGVVQTFAGVTHLYVLSGDVAREREIQIGQRFEDEIEVVSGLAAGEPVIVSGLTRLHDGSPVEVAKAEGKSS
jgi:membrane fusion protein, multidrug efflux system